MDTNAFDTRESEIRGYCRAFPTVFTKASNATQWDEDGKAYIDFFAGAGVLNLGHNHPAMKEAMIDFIQRDGVAHSLDTHTDVKRTFIERFVETVLEPRDMDHKLQFMGPTGTNAVEAALKLARKVTGRSHVVAFSGGFHGMTLGSLALTANDYFRQAGGVDLGDVVRLPFENAPGGGIDNIEAYRAALADPSSGQRPPAAFVVEPIQAEGGVNVASKEWLLAIQSLAKDVGALFVLDDIQAGCARTGSYFSFDEMGLDPDIVTLAKGIGGFGTPMAMNLNRPEHDEHWGPGEHTGTFRGQGLSFVAGTVALDVMSDAEFLTQVEAKGERMRSFLRDLAGAESGKGWAVRGKGMMQAIDVVDGAYAKAVQTEAFNQGLLVGPCGTGGRVIKLIPPLTIPDEALDEGLDILAKAMSAVGVPA